MKKMNVGILLVFAVMALVSVASAFPTEVKGDLIFPSSTSYLKVDVQHGGDTSFPNALYTGWCADSLNSISASDNPFTFNSYSTLALPIPAGPTPADWNKINYVINHNAGKSWKASEMAFWTFGNGGIPFPNPLYPGPAGTVADPADVAQYDALVAAANANPDFEPICDQKYAVVLYSPGQQTIFVEKDMPKCTPSPEFPSMALPLGMIIGLVGLVLVVKRREF